MRQQIPQRLHLALDATAENRPDPRKESGLVSHISVIGNLPPEQVFFSLYSRGLCRSGALAPSKAELIDLRQRRWLHFKATGTIVKETGYRIEPRVLNSSLVLRPLFL